MSFSYALTFTGVPFIEDWGSPLPPPEGEAADPVLEDLLPCPDLLDEIDRLHPFRYGKEWAYPATFLGRNQTSLALPTSPGSDFCPDVRVGEWYYPFGASRWSVFRGLATSEQVRLMLLNCGFSRTVPPSSQTILGLNPGDFVMRAAPKNSDNPEGDPDGWTLATSMHLLPPKPLAEHGGDFEGLYLITLVDKRYFFQGTPVSLRISQDTTWQDLLLDLSTALQITILEVDDFESEPVYGRPQADSQLWGVFENAAPLLDAVAANIGRVVVRNLDGTFELLTAAESEARVVTNRGSVNTLIRNAGGDYFTSGTRLKVGVSGMFAAKNPVVPEFVYVTFPPYVEGDDPVPHFLNTRYRNQRPSAWFEDGYGENYRIIVPITSGGPFASGLVGTSQITLRDTAKALLSGEAQFESGKALNHRGLHDLALQLARDHYGWQVAVALDESYPGTYEWEPDGHHDIVWTYSTRRRLASTRVVKSPWTQHVDCFQHGTPALSGFTNTPRGVGGPSVAQTVRDSYGASGSFVGIPGWSGTIPSLLFHALHSGQQYAVFSGIDNFPTCNRWRGRVLSSDPDWPFSGLRTEIILFEGTSGGQNGYFPLSGHAYSGVLLQSGGGFRVDIALRAIDGTKQPLFHGDGSLVTQVFPDATYGVNLTTYEQMQFQYPHEWTSGGIQGTRVVPQTQSVMVLDDVGVILQDAWHYSGKVVTYDPTQGISGNWQRTTHIWVVERNDPPVAGSGLLLSGHLSGGLSSGNTYSGSIYSGPADGSKISGLFLSGTSTGVRVFLTSGTRYDGQLLGYTAFLSGYADTGPVYGVNIGGGGGETSFLAQITQKLYKSGRLSGGDFIEYSWARVGDGINPVAITYSGVGVSGGPGDFPAYQERDLDLPTFPITATFISSGLLNSGDVINSGEVPLLSGYFNSGIYSGGFLSGYPYPGGIAPQSVVRMRRGAGNYFLFGEEPWHDLFRRTGEVDDYGYVGFLRIWNQNTRRWEDAQEVRLIPAR